MNYIEKIIWEETKEKNTDNLFEKAPCSSIKEIDVDVLGVLRREGKEKIKNGKLMKVDPVWMKFEVILK